MVWYKICWRIHPKLLLICYKCNWWFGTGHDDDSIRLCFLCCNRLWVKLACWGQWWGWIKGRKGKEMLFLASVDNSPPSVIGPDPIVLVRTKISNAAKLGKVFTFRTSLLSSSVTFWATKKPPSYLTQIHSAWIRDHTLDHYICQFR